LPGGRIKITPDQIHDFHGRTLADILAMIPQIWVQRLAFNGIKSDFLAWGRAARNMVWFVDGFPLAEHRLPNWGKEDIFIYNIDSIVVDPSIRPGEISVNLFTRRQAPDTAYAHAVYQPGPFAANNFGFNFARRLGPVFSLSADIETESNLGKQYAQDEQISQMFGSLKGQAALTKAGRFREANIPDSGYVPRQDRFNFQIGAQYQPDSLWRANFDLRQLSSSEGMLIWNETAFDTAWSLRPPSWSAVEAAYDSVDLKMRTTRLGLHRSFVPGLNLGLEWISQTADQSMSVFSDTVRPSDTALIGLPASRHGRNTALQFTGRGTLGRLSWDWVNQEKWLAFSVEPRGKSRDHAFEANLREENSILQAAFRQNRFFLETRQELQRSTAYRESGLFSANRRFFYSPSCRFTYTPAATLDIFGSGGYFSRMPLAYEQYLGTMDFYSQPNAGLLPQRVLGISAGVSWDFSFGSLSGAFCRYGEDSIPDLVAANSPDTGMPVLEYKNRPVDSFYHTVAATLELHYGDRLANTLMFQIGDNGINTWRNVLVWRQDFIRNRLHAFLRLHTEWSFGNQYNFYPSQTLHLYRNGLVTNRFLYQELHIGFRIKNLSLYYRLNNLTDGIISAGPGVQLPGVTINWGMDWDFRE
jgi:hypothetical protein